jgi:hypothetical protein
MHDSARSIPQAGIVHPGLTDQDQDTVSILYDILFRKLSESQGRWWASSVGGLVCVIATGK